MFACKIIDVTSECIYIYLTKDTLWAFVRVAGLEMDPLFIDRPTCDRSTAEIWNIVTTVPLVSQIW